MDNTFSQRMIRNKGKKFINFNFSRNAGFLFGPLWNVVAHICQEKLNGNELIQQEFRLNTTSRC